MSLRIQMLRLFEEKHYEVQIMEIWKPNVDGLRARFPNIIQGDICDLDIPESDIVMWWHGPEHVKKEELPHILTALQKKARKYVVIGSPWGVRINHHLVFENPHDLHLSTLYPSFFENLGWKTSVLGEKDKMGSNLIAWWKNA